MGEFTIIVSNRTEELALRLGQHLHEAERSLMRRPMIWVPSQSMKRWLQFFLLDSRFFQALLGMDFLPLGQGLQRLLQDFGVTWRSPSHLDLSLRIEGWLRTQLERGCASKELQDTLTRLQPQSIARLADQLGALFGRYEMVAEQLFQREDTGWQGELWEYLFGSRAPWQATASVLRGVQATEAPSIDSLHLFGFPYLPAPLLDFVERCRETVSVYHYLLSPTHLYWSDVRPETQAVWMRQQWLHEGASVAQLQRLEELLADCNPLLAGFGRLGREHALWLEEAEAALEERFVVAPELLQDPAYQERLAEVELNGQGGEATLLQRLQADVFVLRDAAREPAVTLPAEESSLEVHELPSRQAEVEVLYDNLMRCLEECERSGRALQGDQIVVQAPDISLYEPWIRMVFGRPDSKIPFQFVDLTLLGRSGLVQAFLHLIKLSEARWTSHELVQLWELPSLRRRQSWSLEDVSVMTRWVRQAQIRWGFDWEHRDRYLEEQGCEHGVLERGVAGTWMDGLSQLMLSLVLKLPADLQVKEAQVTDLDLSVAHAELLGECVHWVKQLYSDLEEMRMGQKHTVSHWVHTLRDLRDRYLAVDHRDKEQCAEWEELEELFLQLERAGATCAEERFPFRSILHHLEILVQQQHGELNQGQLKAVTFCSMLPMRGVPARVLALLGMEEGAWPRQETRHSLDLMANASEVDYTPTRHDHDRYLFLEALLCVRQKLLISYSLEGDSEAGPSYLVSDLIDYADAAFRIGAQSFREACVVKHPYQLSDSGYFGEDLRLKSYSPHRQEVARLSQKSSSRAGFVNAGFRRGEVCSEELRVVDLQDLRRTAANPAASFLRSTCGIRLFKNEWITLEEDECFQLDPIGKARVRREALCGEEVEAFVAARLRGDLPNGSFGRLARRQLEQEVHEARSFLESIEVSPGETFEVRLVQGMREPTQVAAGVWAAPALVLSSASGQIFHIVGTLSDLWPGGLLSFGSAAAAQLPRIWPTYLVMQMLQAHLPLSEKPKLVFARGAKVRDGFHEEPELHLGRLLDFHVACEASLCPLHPSWLPKLLKDPESFRGQTVSDLFGGPWAEFGVDELAWALRGQEESDLANLLEPWRDELESVYGELIARWGSSR